MSARATSDMARFQVALRRMRLLVLDVDGVLTDGGLYYGGTGEALKRFDVKDGHALVMARLAGLPAARGRSAASRERNRARSAGLKRRPVARRPLHRFVPLQCTPGVAR